MSIECDVCLHCAEILGIFSEPVSVLICDFTLGRRGLPSHHRPAEMPMRIVISQHILEDVCFNIELKHYYKMIMNIKWFKELREGINRVHKLLLKYCLQESVYSRIISFPLFRILKLSISKNFTEPFLQVYFLCIMSILKNDQNSYQKA
jgi:hypothetical protein